MAFPRKKIAKKTRKKNVHGGGEIGIERRRDMGTSKQVVFLDVEIIDTSRNLDIMRP